MEQKTHDSFKFQPFFMELPLLLRICFQWFSNSLLYFQFYRPLQHSLATPNSVHSVPHAPNALLRHNYGTSLDDNIVGYHFRDRERELYERQIEFEHELDRERLGNDLQMIKWMNFLNFFSIFFEFDFKIGNDSLFEKFENKIMSFLIELIYNSIVSLINFYLLFTSTEWKR